MRYICAFVFFFAVCASSFGQESKADMFGGYSYVNIDTNGLTARQNANGWEASISGNFSKWFAVEIEGNGYYKNYDIDLSSLNLGTITAQVTDYSYVAGQRINLRPVFFHALFGGDHLTGSAFGVSASQEGLAGVLGGGVQLKVSGPWSIRTSADYVFTRHNILGGSAVDQNNVRVGVGLVYSFGGLNHEHRAEQRNTEMGLPIPALGIVVRLGNNPGGEIVELQENGPAQLAGMNVGDVINTVDEKAVRNPEELAAEMSGRVRGEKIKLGYLIRRGWQAETTVLIP